MLVGWLVVVACGLSLARHLFNLFIHCYKGSSGPEQKSARVPIWRYGVMRRSICISVFFNYVYFYFLCFCQNVMEQLIIAHFIYNALLRIHPKGIFGPILSRNILFWKLVLALQQSWLRKKVVFVWKSWDKNVLKRYHHLLACQGKSIQHCKGASEGEIGNQEKPCKENS